MAGQHSCDAVAAVCPFDPLFFHLPLSPSLPPSLPSGSASTLCVLSYRYASFPLCLVACSGGLNNIIYAFGLGCQYLSTTNYDHDHDHTRMPTSNHPLFSLPDFGLPFSFKTGFMAIADGFSMTINGACSALVATTVRNPETDQSRNPLLSET